MGSAHNTIRPACAMVWWQTSIKERKKKNGLLPLISCERSLAKQTDRSAASWDGRWTRVNKENGQGTLLGGCQAKKPQTRADQMEDG